MPQAGLPTGGVSLEVEFEDVGRAGLRVGYDLAVDVLAGEGFLVFFEFGRADIVDVEAEAAVCAEGGVFAVVEAAALPGEAEFEFDEGVHPPDPLRFDPNFEAGVEGEVGVVEVGRVFEDAPLGEGVDFNDIGRVEVPAEEVNDVTEEEVGRGRSSGPFFAPVAPHGGGDADIVVQADVAVDRSADESVSHGVADDPVQGEEPIGEEDVEFGTGLLNGIPHAPRVAARRGHRFFGDDVGDTGLSCGHDRSPVEGIGRGHDDEIEVFFF